MVYQGGCGIGGCGTGRVWHWFVREAINWIVIGYLRYIRSEGYQMRGVAAWGCTKRDGTSIILLTLFFDSIDRVKTACERLLSLFIDVDATLRFTQPVDRTWYASLADEMLVSVSPST